MLTGIYVTAASKRRSGRLFLLVPRHPCLMSFTFNWPRFSDQFHYDTIQMLNTALNKGNKPPIIADKIEVVELEMGTQVVVCRCCPRSALLTTSTASRAGNT